MRLFKLQTLRIGGNGGPRMRSFVVLPHEGAVDRDPREQESRIQFSLHIYGESGWDGRETHTRTHSVHRAIASCMYMHPAANRSTLSRLAASCSTLSRLSTISSTLSGPAMPAQPCLGQPPSAKPCPGRPPLAQPCPSRPLPAQPLLRPIVACST